MCIPCCSVFGTVGCASQVYILKLLTVSVGDALRQLEDYNSIWDLSWGEHSRSRHLGRAWLMRWGKDLIREKPFWDVGSHFLPVMWVPTFWHEVLLKIQPWVKIWHQELRCECNCVKRTNYCTHHFLHLNWRCTFISHQPLQYPHEWSPKSRSWGYFWLKVTKVDHTVSSRLRGVPHWWVVWRWHLVLIQELHD